MLAGAILFLGLIGITQLLLTGAANERRGEQSLSQSLLVSEALADVTGLGYDAVTVPPGPITVYDAAGRAYRRTVTVTPGSGAYPSYDVTVQIDRSAGAGGTARYVTQSVISQRPGGGLGL